MYRDDNLLYVNGSPAIYATLKDGFDDFNNKEFTLQNGSSVKPRKIKLLVGEYNMTVPVTLNRGKTAILTMASPLDEDGYPAEAGVETCVITRAFTDEEYKNASMITNKFYLTLTKIILDGAKDSDSSNVETNGGIVHMEGDYAQFTLGEGAILRNSKVNGKGGAVYADGNTTVTIANGALTGNEATEGGAVYIAKGARMVLSGGVIGGSEETSHNKADNGGGVYLADSATAEMTGGTITGNEATGENGGAINVGGNKARLIFSGSPVVYDNPNATAGGQQMNVVLSLANTEVIQCKGITGAYDSAKIGVYVVDGEEGAIYNDHGIYRKPFGTFTAGEENLNVFRNDRNGALWGVKNTWDNAQAADKQIYWLDVVCKLTDGDGTLLYTDQYGFAPAVYGTVKTGFEGAGKKLYYKNRSPYNDTNPIQVKMLRDYDFGSGEEDEIINFTKARDLTLTTAETSVSTAMKDIGDIYAYTPATGATGDSQTKATFKRLKVTDTLFTINTGKALTVSNLIVDGDGIRMTKEDTDGGAFNIVSVSTADFNGVTLKELNASGNGGAVYLKSGTLNVTDTNVLECSATNGGAMYVANGAKVTMVSGEMTGNEANGGGALYAATGATVEMTGGKMTSNEAINGGALYVTEDATAEMTGGEISANTATANGGAVYVAKDGVMTLKDGVDESNNATHPTIKDNTITGKVSEHCGAGIYLKEDAKLNLEGSPVFDGNYVMDSDYPGEGTEDDPTKTNGQDDKIYEDGKVRQDIYLQGYANVTNADESVTETQATSIVVTGALDVANGSIWVWADDSAHYKMLTQFATFADSLISNNKVVFPNVDSSKQSDALEKTYLAFRNAQDDVTTECGGDYLTGQEGDAPNLIKWTGGFDFAFRKIDGNGDPFKVKDDDGSTLVVPEFTLYLSVKKDDKLVPVKTGTKDTPAKNVEATALDTSGWQAYQQPDKDHPGQKKDATGKSQTILVSAPVTVKEYAATGKPVDREVYGEGLVPFEKIPPGDYFMVETTRPDTWQSMFDLYRAYVDGSGWISIAPVEKTGDGKYDWPASTPPTKPAEGYTTKLVKGEGDKYTWSETIPSDAETMDIYNIVNVSTLSRKVVLKKIDDTDYKPLKDAKFTVYHADRQTKVEVKRSDGTAETLKDLISGNAGVFWIGKLPYGTYYMAETENPDHYVKPTHYIVFRVDENGVSCSEEKTGEGGVTTTEWKTTNTVSESTKDVDRIPSAPAEDEEETP